MQVYHCHIREQVITCFPANAIIHKTWTNTTVSIVSHLPDKKEDSKVRRQHLFHSKQNHPFKWTDLGSPFFDHRKAYITAL